MAEHTRNQKSATAFPLSPAALKCAAMRARRRSSAT